MFAITGDLEWFSQEFKWPYAMSNRPCAYCQADNLKTGSLIPFTDFRKDACWKATILTAAQADAKYGSHPLMSVPGVNFYTMKLDCLHIFDLGVAMHVFGNLLWEIIEEMPGNRQHALGELNKLIADT